MSTVHKSERVRICTEWLKKQINFKKIVFTDEVRFNLDGPDSMMAWSYGKSRQRKVTKCMGGGFLLLSGELFYDGELFLHFMDKNINSDAYYLEKNMLPFINSKMKNTVILQQDGAKPHTSRGNYSLFGREERQSPSMAI